MVQPTAAAVLAVLGGDFKPPTAAFMAALVGRLVAQVYITRSEPLAQSVLFGPVQIDNFHQLERQMNNGKAIYKSR